MDVAGRFAEECGLSRDRSAASLDRESHLSCIGCNRVQPGNHAVETMDVVDGFTRRFGTGETLFHPVDAIDILGNNS